MGDAIMIVATVVAAGASIAIAVFTMATWRTYRRIEWFTGSMDSIQTKLLALEIEKINRAAPEGQRITAIWWDPTIKPFPVPGHFAPVENSGIYIGIPRQHRARQPTLWSELTRIIHNTAMP